MAKSKKDQQIADELRAILRAPQGEIDVRDFDPHDDRRYPGQGKEDADDYTQRIEPKLDNLQEKLFANGRATPHSAPRVLLVLQGMDTAGKGGIVRHVIGMVDPQGVHIKAFKAPTEQELAHDFLWRVNNALPGPGMIGIFDRSHYEDVLVQRVEGLASPEEIERRYGAINQWEEKLVASGTRVIKCFLNVSRDEQQKRLLQRLDNPEKYWKYNPGDVDVAKKWDQYMDAYSIALTRCNTDAAPWHIIPSDRKWYRNWCIAELLVAELDDLNLEWPTADFDVAAEQQRVAKLVGD